MPRSRLLSRRLAFALVTCRAASRLFCFGPNSVSGLERKDKRAGRQDTEGTCTPYSASASSCISYPTSPACTSAYPAPPRQIRAPMVLLSTPRLPFPRSLPFRCPREVEALTPSSVLPLSAHSQPGIPAGLTLAPGRTQSLTPNKARGPRPPSHIPHKPQISHLAVPQATQTDFPIIKSVWPSSPIT